MGDVLCQATATGSPSLLSQALAVVMALFPVTLAYCYSRSVRRTWRRWFEGHLSSVQPTKSYDRLWYSTPLCPWFPNPGQLRTRHYSCRQCI